MEVGFLLLGTLATTTKIICISDKYIIFNPVNPHNVMLF